MKGVLAPPLLLGGRLAGVTMVAGLEAGRGVLSLTVTEDMRRERKRGLPSALAPLMRREREAVEGELASRWPRSTLYGLFMGPLAVMMLCIRCIFCRVSCAPAHTRFRPAVFRSLGTSGSRYKALQAREPSPASAGCRERAGRRVCPVLCEVPVCLSI